MRTPEQITRELETISRLGHGATTDERRQCAWLMRLTLRWVLAEGKGLPSRALRRLTVGGTNAQGPRGRGGRRPAAHA